MISRAKVAMVFGRVSGYLRSDMDRHGITGALGEARIFATLHEAIAAVQTGARGQANASRRCREPSSGVPSREKDVWRWTNKVRPWGVSGIRWPLLLGGAVGNLIEA